MEVRKFTLGPVLTNMYIVSENGHGFMVDACDISKAVDDYINENDITIDFILQTHTHYDHVLGLEYYKNLFDVDVYAGLAAKEIANDVNYNLGFAYPNLNVPIDRYLEDGEIFSDYNIKVLKTPGHSLDSVSYLLGEHLFSGDALFNLSIGRTDLPGGDYETLINSINDKYRGLDPNTNVYPGHNTSTTLGFEFLNNPFLN